MAIGYQVSMSGINNKAGQLAFQWQALAYNTLQFTGPIATLGSSGLQALTPGFTPTDAANMVAAALLMADLSGLYYGTAAQSPAFNYDATLLQLRGAGGAG